MDMDIECGNNLGQEIHAYQNDDGTYRVVLITNATKDGLFGKYLSTKEEAVVTAEIPMAMINLTVLRPPLNTEDNHTWTITLS